MEIRSVNNEIQELIDEDIQAYSAWHYNELLERQRKEEEKKISRLSEIEEQCSRYDKQHPQVWKLFVFYSFDRIRRGYKHYSVSAIFERIRWHMDSGTNQAANSFKLNNNYRAVYSRKFHKNFPEYSDFFRTRIQTSKDTEATGLPELGPLDYDN